MISHRNKNPKTAKTITLVIFLVLVLAFVFTPLARWSFDGLEGVFLNAARNGSDTAGIIDSIFHANEQISELKNLRAENESLRAKLVMLLDRDDIDVEEGDYENLYKSDSQILRVAMRPPASGFDVIVLEKRSDARVSVGDKVITDGNVILGEVEEVFDKSIRVKLFTYVGEETLGFFETQEMGKELIGNGNNNFEVQISREIDINEGDLVYYSQNQNYLLGIVKKVIFDARDPYKTVLVAIPVNIQHLQYVKVIH